MRSIWPSTAPPASKRDTRGQPPAHGKRYSAANVEAAGYTWRSELPEMFGGDLESGARRDLAGQSLMVPLANMASGFAKETAARTLSLAARGRATPHAMCAP
jgi:hypothetical protein